MVPLTGEARLQVRALKTHYSRLHRIEALKYLALAVAAAQIKIARSPEAGLAAPRPYKHLAQEGLRWIKEHVYWIEYSLDPLAIIGVYYETLDIPSRIR